MKEYIYVKGAKEHNLKNIDIKIPRDKLVVFTGISGSGKSSLAFDTIFAEGQRRYVESLSSYARQFLGQMKKPDVEFIEGLSPAISIDQRTTSHNPRSTVGTVTEIYDYLRLLYARVGKPHCHVCGKEISKQTVDEICDGILKNPVGTKLIIMSPVVRGRKGEYNKLLESMKKSGYIRVKIDGIIYDLDEPVAIDKNVRHSISVVIDRLVVKDDMNRRVSDSVETALKLSDGLVAVDADGVETLYSSRYSCPDCGVGIEELEPRLFSFNSPFGACPECTGLGFTNEIDLSKIVKPERSVADGAVEVSGWNMDGGKIAQAVFNALADKYGFSVNTPFKDLSKDVQNMLLYGNKGEKFEVRYSTNSFSGKYMADFEGVINNLLRRYRETTSDYVKREIESLMISTPCRVCGGKRLKKEALAVTVGGRDIRDITTLSIDGLYEFMANIDFTETQKLISEQIMKEILSRLNFLRNVGLNYLTLARSAGTLSGGEAQRIRLATQIGSGLMGVLYILDEPSIGLHQRDNDKLLAALKRLRDLGNTLVVVEHDEDTMRAADYIVDIGPGAGVNGGRLVASGTIGDIEACAESVTGQYLSGAKKIEFDKERTKADGRYLEIIGAKQNNLKNLDVKIPLGLMTCITGVSGSGKSSLINEILYPYLANNLNNARQSLGRFDEIRGAELLDKVIDIDQSPIGRTPRSNPATYTGVFTNIRKLFAATPDAKVRGFKDGRFSFNVAGGRCENCCGDGVIKIEMHFLPDIYVPCEVCREKRYNRETLEVKYKGKNIYDVLEMPIDEACAFFENQPSIYGKIKTLYDVGLGYVKLGQPATTLSGGEAQRVKLAAELSKRGTGKTVYILDEPTTGLHTADVDKLLTILKRLKKGGNTVIIIEHNLDVIKSCDYIIDLGPEGGDAGGFLVAAGTPEQIAEANASYTGEFLKKVLSRD
ncbi:MAG: excinuclease ABC subunit UvrA [Clostridiales bacterium]|jgi:excinuclease ABC subunit A|nr:excinuclease ABC subunit UvrA [Clostridiales bacterium]